MSDFSSNNRIFTRLFLIVSLIALAAFLCINVWKLDLEESTSRTVHLDLSDIPQSQQEDNTEQKDMIELGAPEISGWIAWWKEEEGFEIVDKYAKDLSCISPGWLKLDSGGQVVELGKIDKKATSRKMRGGGILFYPMIVTDFNDEQLSAFIESEGNLTKFIEAVINKLKELEADGLDLDFENIGEQYQGDFSRLIKELGKELRRNNLKFSVTIQAQTGKNDWSGLMGQDLELIAREADEVRIMIYDRHGEFSDPGPITPLEWFKEVISYNFELIPREKIVIGLPTYGYLWRKNGSFESYQHKEFVALSQNSTFEITRDPESFELKYENADATGWLSDSVSVEKKIEFARSIGLNRFVIWSLGGTDEALFATEWKSVRSNP